MEYEAGTRGLQYAASKGLAVVNMEPLHGGALARNIPPAVLAPWDNTPTPPPPLRRGRGKTSPPPQRGGQRGGCSRTPADWALQWLWNQPEVSLVLSGMSTFEQACSRRRPGVEQNLARADRSGAGAMTDEELSLIAQAREAHLAPCAVPCTSCQYCLPCPNGVATPEVLGVYNESRMFDD